MCGRPVWTQGRNISLPVQILIGNGVPSYAMRFMIHGVTDGNRTICHLGSLIIVMRFRLRKIAWPNFNNSYTLHIFGSFASL
jgi:hypothetical protein